MAPPTSPPIRGIFYLEGRTLAKFGQSQAKASIKSTKPRTHGLAAASIKNPNSLYTFSIPVLGFTGGFVDLIKTTFQQSGNNLLGKTYHFIKSTPLVVGPKPKCYPAIITAVHKGTNFGILVNLSWTDDLGIKQSAVNVPYQGYDATGPFNRWVYPNFHPSTHNATLYPVPGTLPAPAPAGTEYFPALFAPPPTNTGTYQSQPLGPQYNFAPVRADVAPSPTYTGCIGLQDSQVAGGAPTVVCYCNGVETYRVSASSVLAGQQGSTEQALDIGAITTAHGACQDSGVVTPSGPIEEGFVRRDFARADVIDFGETNAAGGHIPFAYISVNARIQYEQSVPGLTNVFRSGINIDDIFGSMGSTAIRGDSVFRGVRIALKSNINIKNDVFMGYYQTNNNIAYLLTGYTMNGTRYVQYKQRTPVQLNGPDITREFQISWNFVRRNTSVQYDFYLDSAPFGPSALLFGINENDGQGVGIFAEKDGRYSSYINIDKKLYDDLQYRSTAGFNSWKYWGNHANSLAKIQFEYTTGGFCLDYPSGEGYLLGGANCSSINRTIGIL